MTKSMWVAVTVLFVLFAACGVFMVLLQKDEDAKSVHRFLSRNKLVNIVSYRDNELSLTDMVVLNDVSLRLPVMPALKNGIGQFVLNDYKTQRGMMSHLSFAATNVSFSWADVAHLTEKSDEDVVDALAFFNPLQDIPVYPLYALMLAGCGDVSADVTARLDYRAAKGTTDVSIGLDDKCLGKWRLSVSFAHMTDAKQGQLVIALKNLMYKGTATDNVKRFLDGSSVTSFTLSYEETGLITGYMKYVDSVYLRQQGTPVFSVKNVEAVTDYLSQSNAHRQRNADIARTLTEFVKNPRRIVFQSKAGKEVPLRVLSGTFLRQMTDMLLRLDTSVTTEKPAL